MFCLTTAETGETRSVGLLPDTDEAGIKKENDPMKFFTADWHLWHENMLDLCGRPFNKCNQMHKKLLYNHNSLVGPKDTLYILGDVYWKNSPEELERIIRNYNGRKILILGNHDRLKPFEYVEAGFESVHTSLDIEDFILVHDPCYSIVHPDRNYLCGHVHDLFVKQKNALNVGVDVWDFKPISLDVAKGCLRRRKDET